MKVNFRSLAWGFAVIVALSLALFLRVGESPVFAEIPQSDLPEARGLFLKAAENYDAEEFQSAVEIYEQLIGSGYMNGNVFYNLGNACLENDSLGQAILNYEKASILIPGDSDLLTNYAYARSLIKQEDTPEGRILILKFLDEVFAKMTISVIMSIFFLLYFGLVIYIIFSKIFKKTVFLSNAAIIVWVLVLTAVVLPLKYRMWDMETGAIVTTRITDARFEPQDDAMPHFPLYEGMKINIVREYGEWYRITRRDGRIGWVKRSDISKIIPL